MVLNAPSKSGQFQSTLSVRRATQLDYMDEENIIISIHALREESDALYFFTDSFCFSMSIHALREESDLSLKDIDGLTPISIHALREESDSTTTNMHMEIPQFQSTLSVRRATQQSNIRGLINFEFQSTLSVRRATAQRN